MMKTRHVRIFIALFVLAVAMDVGAMVMTRKTSAYLKESVAAMEALNQKASDAVLDSDTRLRLQNLETSLDSIKQSQERNKRIIRKLKKLLN